MLPLLDLGFIPIRYAVAYVMVNSTINQLALARSAGNARQALERDSGWKARLAGCGIRVKKSDLSIVVTDRSNQQHRFRAGQKGVVPGDLLPNPDPEKPRLVYRLEISTSLEISPLFTMRGQTVPGLTSPVPVGITALANWENLAGDPETGEFYINE